MRISAVLCVVLLLAVSVLAFGCAEEEPSRKLVSRPSQTSATPLGGSPADGPSGGQDVEETPEPVDEPVYEPEPVAGEAFCEQLSVSEIGNVFAGSWSKTGDCPVRPAMPAGVDVCQCSYDGPGQLYVNVETQLYSDAEEAERVYNMYCSGTEEEDEVGDASCRAFRSTSTRPNFVYFLQGNHFVKVSCLGGPCPLDAVAELAKQVGAEI